MRRGGRWIAAPREPVQGTAPVVAAQTALHLGPGAEEGLCSRASAALCWPSGASAAAAGGCKTHFENRNSLSYLLRRLLSCPSSAVGAVGDAMFHVTVILPIKPLMPVKCAASSRPRSSSAAAAPSAEHASTGGLSPARTGTCPTRALSREEKVLLVCHFL